MQNIYKKLVILELVIIIILSIIAIKSSSDKKIEYDKKGLLSPRIYSGLLEPKSYLITNFSPLEKNIKDFVGKNNINVSVYIQNLRDGSYIYINDKLEFFPVSLNKLPIAILIMQKVESGELSLDKKIPIREEDRTDAYGELYLTKEDELPLSILMEKMLRESDNTAMHALIHYINGKDLDLLTDYYAIDLNVYYPSRRIYGNHSIYLTPKVMSNIFTSLYLSTALEDESSEYILSLMTNTTFDVNKLAGIPNEVIISHKFGAYYVENIKYFHDCGIMYIDKSKILYCIMTKDLNQKDATKVIGIIMNNTYNYVKETRKRLDSYKNEN